MDTHGSNHDLLSALLEICEDFFAAACPATHGELDALLRTRGITGGHGWLIDMLALTRLRLHATHPDQTPAADRSAVKTRGD